MLFTRTWLLFTPYSVLVTRYPLLFTLCALRFALHARCITRYPLPFSLNPLARYPLPTCPLPFNGDLHPFALTRCPVPFALCARLHVLSTHSVFIFALLFTRHCLPSFSFTGYDVLAAFVTSPVSFALYVLLVSCLCSLVFTLCSLLVYIYSLRFTFVACVTF